MFKCDFLKAIPGRIESFFKDQSSKLTSDEDMYYAYMMYKNAEGYGIKG